MNKHTHIFKVISASCISAGALLLIVSSLQADVSLQLAQLSSQGSTLGPRIEKEVVERELAIAAPHASAPDESAVQSVGLQVALGMLLILIGFGFHALLVMKNHEPIRTYEVAHHPIDTDATQRRTMEVFWLEVDRDA